MRYLKLFENINDDGYVNITSEYRICTDIIRGKKDENFLISEISEIKKTVKDIGEFPKDFKCFNPIDARYKISNIISISYRNRHYYEWNILSIYKKKDEWFYVYDMRNNGKYECDQMEGLLNCIKCILPNFNLPNF